MLKIMLSRKIMVIISALFALLLIYMLPKEKVYTLKQNLPQDLKYVSDEQVTDVIYLLGHDDYLGQTTVATSKTNRSVESRARELIEILISDGSGENKIPNGFLSILPSDTKILSLKYDNHVLKINFSKELMDVKAEHEEKMVEAIVYTLTSITEVEKVILYLEGDILSKLPQSKVNLPATLDRSFGINKDYDITSTKDINQVTIYYLDKYNDTYYYVPVTKYVNDNREKIMIIVDELTSNYSASGNLLSFINSNTKLLSINKTDDVLELGFNDYIFNDINERDILEEVIYTITYSVKSNYDVANVVFEVNNQEIHKSTLKTIE
jgi:germination protein M